MQMPEIRIIQSSDHQAWDQHLQSHEQCGPYLTTAWKNAVEEGYGHKTFYLAAYNEDVIVGVLPLVLVKSFMTKGVLVSLPFCDYGGILATDPQITVALINRALDLADEMHAALEIRNPRPCLEIEQEFIYARCTDKCRMVLELPGSARELWSGFKAKLRSQIKKGAKNGLVFRIGGVSYSDDFYRVFSRNMRDLGSPVHSVKWLNSVVSSFGENARIGVVYKGADPIGAGIILMCKNTVTIPWASTLKRFNKLGPNMLLYWSFLEYAADLGCQYFDFGRSMPGEGTYVFKQQWGTRPVPLAWYRISRNSHQRPFSNADGLLRNVVERVWCRLPLTVANNIGPHVRKYINR